MNRTLRAFAAAVLAVALAACDTSSGGDPAGPGTWEPAFDATETGWLLNAAGRSADDLYTVGGTPEAGVIVHWDGAAWEPVDPGVDVPLLNWVHTFDDGQAAVVGNAGTALHFDGTSWRLEPTPTDQDLWGVWGASPDDLWAVGGNGRDAGQATVLRWDGAAWTAAEVPEMDRPQVNAFYKVWGSSADDVYVVGQRGGALHWDGEALEELHLGVDEDLVALWGTGPDRIVVVGGLNNGVVARWDGTSWESRMVTPAPRLSGVWMDSPDTAWVAGNRGTLGILDVDTLTLRDDPYETQLDFHGIFGVPGGGLLAVGGNLFAAGVDGYRGVAVQRRRADGE